jgi:type II secretory pathway pseudopilin PulG
MINKIMKKNQTKSYKTSDSVFTFFETIIVITVISVLFLITWGQYQTSKAKARDVARKNDLHEISKAIQLYYADYGHLPSKDIKGDPDINQLGGKSFTDSHGYVYMKEVPMEKYIKDKPYCYIPDNENKSFKLFMELEVKSNPDCKEGTYVCGGSSYCYTDTIYVDNQKSK